MENKNLKEQFEEHCKTLYDNNEHGGSSRWLVSPVTAMRYILSFLEKEISDAEQRGRGEVVDYINTMKLWSKGTVEGTRKDIIYKLEACNPKNYE